MNERRPQKLYNKQEQSASLPILQQIQSKINRSSLVDQYCRLINGLDFEPVDQAALAACLLSEGIKYSKDFAQYQLLIVMEQYSSNYEAIKINVSYGFFCTSLYLINIDTKKKFSNSAKSFAGAFGSVQKFLVDGTPFAIKSIKFEDESFSSVFREVVKECFLLKIASALQVGPKSKNIFGFDIVAYRNCLDFSMQFCEPASQNDNPHTLKRSLSILHRFNIVHMDIKPQNIAFSYHHERLVFIDFGLSKAIKEEIGYKSYTNFIGSFIYCSSEMLSLYAINDFGFVDLYYNDAHCLNLSLQKIQETKFVTNQPQLFDQNHDISFGEYILKQKFIMFLLGSDSIFSVTNLSYIVSKMNNHILLGFILTLPQRVNIIAHYKQLMRDKEESNDGLHILYQDYASEHLNHQKLFKDRFSMISRINYDIFTSIRGDDGFQRLFDEEATSHYKLEVYSLALIKFIKINSDHIKFEKKLTACKVFSRQYIKDQMAEEGISLYRKVVSYIFKLSMKSNQPQRYQILRESIQTVAILQLVPENSFIEAFFTVFEWELRFILRIRLAFQFITVLQFLREKYRKTYNDERLLQVFMQKLNTFIDEVNTQSLDQQQKMIIADVKFMINFRFIQNIQQVGDFLKQEKRYLSIQIKRLKEDMQMYLASYILLTDIDKFNIYFAEEYRIIITRLVHYHSYSTRFIYSQLALYHLYCCTDQLSSTEDIYQHFHKQFSPHWELTYFKIYFFHRINTIKLNLSLISLSQRHEYGGKLPDITQPQFKYHQIFDMLNWLVNNTANFHYMLRYLLLNLSWIELYISSESIYSFIKANIDRITMLTNKYHQANKRHRNDLKIEITLFNAISDFVANYQKFRNISEQAKTYQIIKNKISKFYHIISLIQCFKCKSFALYQLKNSLHFQIADAEKSQQNLMQVVDSLILALKNRQLKQNIFPLMILLIRASLLSEQLKRKYDFIGIFYEYVSKLERYHHTLVSIRQCNLFLKVYIMIYQKYTPKQLITFIFKTCNSLGQRYSNLFIDNFYYSLVYMVGISKQQQQQLFRFKDFHDFIVGGLFDCLKIKNNPYISIYFAALLKVHLISGIQDKMLKFICLSLNSLNHYAKVIILCHYYSHYEYYLPISKRKKYSLILKHFKNCYDRMPIKQIIKLKISGKLARDQLDLARYTKLKAHVESYHKNLGNIRI